MNNNILQALSDKNAARKKSEVATNGLDLLNDTEDNSKFRKQCAVDMQSMLESGINNTPIQQNATNSNLVRQEGWKTTV